MDHVKVLAFDTGGTGRRPVFGDSPRHHDDPAFRDHLLFHEYFHGKTGRGIGASHQTGWTGLVALLLRQVSRQQAIGTQPDAATQSPAMKVPLAAE